MKRRHALVLAASIVSIGALMAAGCFIWLESWQPKPFPACPDLPGTTKQWRGLTFLVPNGWTTEERPKMPQWKDRSDLFLRPHSNPYESIVIAEDSSPRFREFFNRDEPDSSAVPGTIERIKLLDRKAVFFLAKETGMHGQMHGWELAIDKGPSIVHVSGMNVKANPSWSELAEVKKQHCAYWSIVRSLKVD